MIHINETVKRYQTINRNYYSFKVFRSFLLAQILRLILHNQLALTKFGRRLRYMENEVNREVLTTKLRCFGGALENGRTFHTKKKWPNYSLKRS